MREPKTPKAWANFLSRLWGPRFPVDVREIALDYSGQRFSDAPIAKIKGVDIEGFEGALISRPPIRRWFILYNEAVDIPGRINFTIGHEFGHYLLHRDEALEFHCSQADLLDYGGRESQIREKEANEFASYLLMPMDDFRRQVGKGRVSLDIIGHCADRYNVTLTAATLKWLEFTTQRAVLVVARDDVILWSRSSAPAWESGVFYRKGTPLPDRSIAKTGLPSGSLRAKKDGFELSPGIWRPDESVTEMAIISDRYDMTISLLLLQAQVGRGFQAEDRRMAEIEESELQESWTPKFSR